MKEVTPRVHLIAATEIDEDAIYDYLRSIGAHEYRLPEVQPADALTEVAGKQCYRSWEPGLNPNVTKVRDDNKVYIDNICKHAHGAVTEHATFSFIFQDVSRVFTHELVRHRVGVAISQESLRYVRLTDLSFWMPTILKELDNEAGEGQAILKETVEYLEKVQNRLAEVYKVDERDFHTKKLLTSGFRRVAPIGLATGMVWSANVRTLKHCIQMRTSRFAEEEIRLVFHTVAVMCKTMAPHLFDDMYAVEAVEGIPEWESKYASNPYDNVKLERLQKEIKLLVSENTAAAKDSLRLQMENADLQKKYDDLKFRMDGLEK